MEDIALILKFEAQQSDCACPGCFGANKNNAGGEFMESFLVAYIPVRNSLSPIRQRGGRLTGTRGVVSSQPVVVVR